MDIIRSKNNDLVKKIVSYHQGKNARRENVIFLEGKRLCEDALKTGCFVRYVILREDKLDSMEQLSLDYSIDKSLFVALGEDAFDKISFTMNPQGIALVIDSPGFVNEIPFKDDGLDIIAVLEDIQDPGNMGTIIRTCDAFGFTAVCISKLSVDPFNEKALRSSMGSALRMPIYKYESTTELMDIINNHNMCSLSCDLHGESLREADINLPAAFFIGNEGKGLSKETSDMCSLRVKIPMIGQAESLNASSAASIIGYVLSTLK